MTGSDLVFNADLHEYRLPDGRRVPSVTEVLSATGVACDYEALRADLGRTVADQIDFRRDLGTAVHHDAWALDDGDLVLETVDDRVKPYLDAWLTFRQHLKLSPISRERRVLHPVLEYAGTYDGLFHQQGTAKRVLVDLKTANPDDGGAKYQLSAYQAAHEAERPDEPVDERWAVWLQPELAIPYRIFNYSDRVTYPDGWRDWQCFQSFLVTYRCQHASRARRRAA